MHSQCNTAPGCLLVSPLFKAAVNCSHSCHGPGSNCGDMMTSQQLLPGQGDRVVDWVVAPGRAQASGPLLGDAWLRMQTHMAEHSAREMYMLTMQKKDPLFQCSLGEKILFTGTTQCEEKGLARALFRTHHLDE